MVGTQLDQISTIARLVYGKTCALLVQLFDEVAGRYQDQIQQTTDAWQLIEGNWAPVYWILGSFMVKFCKYMFSKEIAIIGDYGVVLLIAIASQLLVLLGYHHPHALYSGTFYCKKISFAG